MANQQAQASKQTVDGGRQLRQSEEGIAAVAAAAAAAAEAAEAAVAKLASEKTTVVVRARYLWARHPL